ncbi:hypothetical protein ZOSMA_44G00010 [Zostera marina]|uniref:Uncharacterized protein n=1 Tax=Zostera marina TaxID=29655 RepID=A0A0K9P312_ZOSMR|nr:hypothetical protein ZOSMA_44G00010 [Zostera marina]
MVVGTQDQNDHSDDPSDDQHSDHHDVDMNTKCSKKKSNRNDKAIVIFEDDEIVYDKAAEKLKKKMNMVANDFKLLPIDYHGINKMRQTQKKQ